MAPRNRNKQRLNQDVFSRDAVTVARFLLGKSLVRFLDGQRLVGRIVETEAYCPAGTADLACHASKNGGRPTERTSVMFGPAGHAYVYFNYGIHWLFNVVTGPAGEPGAVLLRALVPIEGIEMMRDHRKRPDKELTNGPAKLTQALQIDGRHNGMNLCHAQSVIWIEDGFEVDQDQITSGPRVGLGKTPEPWYSMPWRFLLDEEK